jgi:tRNA wybutosine-synthesizing protein 3
MDFENNKKTFLSKKDKSKKGSIDRRISALVEKINRQGNYYSTSSCSGRIVLLKESKSGRKNQAQWLFVSHDLVDFHNIFSVVDELSDRKDIWFKYEPPIIHISCRDLVSAQKLLNIARPIFKLSGIISTSKNIVEIRATDRIDTPVEEISQKHLRILVETGNRKLETGWKKLKEFESQIA